MIIKKRLYLPFCKYLWPRALFCGSLCLYVDLIHLWKEQLWWLILFFYNIPFSVPVHPPKIFRIAMIFSQNISKCIPTDMRWTRDVECLSPPKFPIQLAVLNRLFFIFSVYFNSPFFLTKEPGPRLHCTTQHSTVSTNCALEKAKDGRD